MRLRAPKFLIVAVALSAGLFAAVPSADAYLYWTNKETSKIARAFTDGAEPLNSFTGPPTVASSTAPFGIAVDSSHIYWTSPMGRTINRSNLDGTGMEVLVTLPSDGFGSQPHGIAVDGSHIYWVDRLRQLIGRADLDGSNSQPSFINTSPRSPRGVAVDSDHIYWTSYVPGAIGRADIDGTDPNADFVTGLTYPFGLAVDSNYLYWSNNYEALDSYLGTIGRVSKDGTSNKNTSWITGTSYTTGVAVDANYVYWVNENWSNVGRAKLDGTSPNQFFSGNGTAGVVDIGGIAVDSGGPASPTLALVGKATKKSLKLNLTCGDADACQIALSGKKVGGTAAQKIVAKTVNVSAGGSLQTSIAYTAALKKALAKGGRILITAARAHTGPSTLTVKVAR